MGNKGENKIKNYNDYLKETMDRIDWNEENAKAWIRKNVEEKITDIIDDAIHSGYDNMSSVSIVKSIMEILKNIL